MNSTPGVYFEQVDRARPAIGPLRTDIAGIVGYAERGPLMAPVKLTSWLQFTTVFGNPLSFAYLADAVRGFFDNRGAACYVVRVADKTAARAASVTLPGEDSQPTLRLWTSHGELHDPVTNSAQVEHGRPVRLDSPGSWGNRLFVSVLSAGLGTTLTTDQPLDGLTSQVEGLSGFAAGTIVRLSQNGKTVPRYRCITAIDPHLRQITWDAPLTGIGLDLNAPIRLESVEFTLYILLDGQIVERHQDLSLSKMHSRYVVDVLRAGSNLIDAAVLLESPATDLATPARWPASVDLLQLTDGQDGLTTVDKDDFLAGLAALETVDEVSLLIAPDVVLRAEAPAPGRRAVTATSPCDVLAPPPGGQLKGLVLEQRGESDDIPISGVRVRVLGSTSRPAVTDADGEFTLTGLPIAQVTLLFERDGYYNLEVTAQACSVLPAEPARFYLAPVTLPPALSLDDIFDIQTAMMAQGENGLYRVALLDPPEEMLDLEKIQTWRARFDSAYAALYYPWLIVNSSDSVIVRDVPPGGHVAGLIARTDLSQGVHRAPANFILENVKALTREVNDSEQGVLNPQGINCMRVLPGRGIRIYGARTLSSDPEWRYLNVRRLVLMIEETIEESNQWAVFEPNNQILRQALTYNLNSFMNTLWQQGALAGDTPAAAFQVKCDEDNNPADIVDAGQVIAEIAVAPTIPYEFIKFRLGRTVEALEVTE